MGKSINNPFSLSPEMKSGLSPDPGIVRPGIRMQENRSGVQRVPQRPQPASGQRSDGSRGYRVPAPSGAVTAGASRPTMTPAAPAHANKPAQAAGNGVPVKSQTPTPDSSMKVSAKNPNKAVSKGQVNAQAGVNNTAGIIMADGLKLDFSGDNLLRGFVMSEVLGRPKCLRRGRW